MIPFPYILTFISTVFIYFLVQLVLKLWKRSKLNLPPGPYGVPLLGYLPFLGKDPHLEVTRLGKKYGSVFRMQMGKHNGVVLHDWKAVKAAFVDQGDIFAGRPVLDVSAALSGGLFGIILNEGQAWKEQRKFGNQQLRELGVGKSVAENSIETELADFMGFLEKDGKNGLDIKTLLFVPIMNVIWMMTAGRRFEYGAKETTHFSDRICEMINLTGLQADILYLPNIFIKLGYKKKLIARRHAICTEALQLMQREIDKHKRPPEENPHDFIAAYLVEMEKQKNKPIDKRQTSFSETQLQHVCLNFFVAGVETTATTLGWACLYLSMWPEIQEKVHQELDAVYGDTRTPTWADRSLLPYCSATILESQRMASVLPFSVLHRAHTSTTVLGYHIPKDSLMIPNLYNISYDPELWGDPHYFRPERFLNEEGVCVTPDYLLPYSAGPRTCLGAPLARMELFIFFTNMFQQFKFKLPDGAPRPSLKAKFGLTFPPPDDLIIVEKRKFK